MSRRLKLQELLENMLGSEEVHFQAPKNRSLVYPCIIYKLIKIGTKNANDKPYIKNDSYSITLIHKDPENELKDELAMLPMCSMDRFFISDNLNHYVYTIYF